LVITILTDKYPEDLSWDLLNDNDEILLSGADLENQKFTYEDVICLSPGSYQFVINDSYGDGLVIQNVTSPNYAEGYYSLTLDGEVIKTTCCGPDNDFDSVDQFAFEIGGPFPTPPPTLPPSTPPPTPPPSTPPSTCNSGKTDIVLDFKFDDYSEDTSWKITDFNDKKTVIEKKQYTNGLKRQQETVGLCNNNCYAVIIKDSIGNGMCCQEGNGKYNIFVNGIKEIKGNGKFKKQKIEKVCLDQNGQFVGGGGNNKCKDNKKFKYKGDPNKDCAWVKENKPELCNKNIGKKRCKKSCEKC